MSKLAEKLINKENINETLKFIDESVNAYVSDNGNVYIDYGNNMFLRLKPQLVYGYEYVAILIRNTNKRTSKRVHRLVAKAFIENPNNYKIVGHKNNVKNDNKVENLYWTTTQENTQKAFDDGLIINAKSWDDSQSIAVCQFDINGNYIQCFGSISECSKITTMTKTGIIQQCNHMIKTKPRKGFYYRYKSEYDDSGFVL